MLINNINKWGTNSTTACHYFPTKVGMPTPCAPSGSTTEQPPISGLKTVSLNLYKDFKCSPGLLNVAFLHASDVLYNSGSGRVQNVD